MPVLLILFALIMLPLAEIAIFIWLGGLIGLVPTLVLTISAVLLGAALARHEGFTTLRNTMKYLDRGEIPVDEILSGAILMVAAILLMTPGFLTAAVGFVLLIRPLRLWIGRRTFALLAVVRGHGPGWDPRTERRTIELEAYHVDHDPR